MEYMLTVGLVLLMVLPAIFLFYRSASDSTEEIDLAQINKIGNEIVTTAEDVYYLGIPSRIFIEERLPSNVESISVIQDPVSQTYMLAIAIRTRLGISNLTYPSSVNMFGLFRGEDISEGIKNIRVEAKSGIGGQLFTSISFERPLSRVFATSTAYDGDFGSILEANDLCQQHADSVSLSGTWNAWLSNDSHDARDLINDAFYVRVDGLPIATNRDDLIDGTIENPIDLDENLGPVATSIWTGTKFDGTVGSTHCNDWQGGGSGRVGSSSDIDNKWTEDGARGCGSSRPIYCFEQ